MHESGGSFRSASPMHFEESRGSRLRHGSASPGGRAGEQSPEESGLHARTKHQNPLLNSFVGSGATRTAAEPTTEGISSSEIPFRRSRLPDFSPSARYPGSEGWPLETRLSSSRSAIRAIGMFLDHAPPENALASSGSWCVNGVDVTQEAHGVTHPSSPPRSSEGVGGARWKFPLEEQHSSTAAVPSSDSRSVLHNATPPSIHSALHPSCGRTPSTTASPSSPRNERELNPARFSFSSHEIEEAFRETSPLRPFVIGAGAQGGRFLRPFVIGVCGATCSGKSTLCDILKFELGAGGAASTLGGDLGNNRVAFIPSDSFYRDLDQEALQLAHEAKYDFDHPSAIAWDELIAAVRVMKRGGVLVLIFATLFGSDHLSQ